MNILLWYTLCTLFLGYVSIVMSFDMFFSAIGLGAAAITGYLGRCRLMECCDDNWIINDVNDLEMALQRMVFGQHLAVDIVSKAVRAHVKSQNPKKALTLSFHGWPGGGKNYVSQFIVTRLYKEGFKSKYAHLFSGRIHFPLASEADIYRIHLQDWIRGNVSNCERSLFIFDEVEKIPRGVLDGVKPFLDYHERIAGVDFRKSIFIFMGNTGGNTITKRYLELWEAGKKREDMELRDYEDLLRRSVFNEAGGLHKSETIESNLIDHYVPFLPLEEKHVRKCIKSEFGKYLQDIPEEYIDEILKDVTFGPEENKMFSSTGCKRLSQKVAALNERMKW